MKKFIALSILGVSSFVWVPTAEAQYEGSDARYAEERRAEKQQWRWIKIGAGAVVLVGFGAVWAFKKMRGTE